MFREPGPLEAPAPSGGKNSSHRRVFDGVIEGGGRLFNRLGSFRNGLQNASDTGMSGSISGLPSSYLQSILESAFQKAGLATSQTAGNPGAVDASSALQKPDGTGLSPFAQLMSTLQKLQQSDPTKYQQVTQQIAGNLQSAAATAQSDGNTAAATQLTQLASDFTDASKSGQLPNVQDLAKAVGGGHHHHHHAHAASADSDANSSTSGTSGTSGSSSTDSAAETLSQLLSAYQSNGTQNDSLNPMSIILNTLSSAGITTSNS